MRKLKKSIILGLSIAALGVSTYNVSKTYALENQKSYTAQNGSLKSSEIGVTDEDELIAALENPAIKKVILKNDIKISKKENEREIIVTGDSKEITSESSTSKYTLSSIFEDKSNFSVTLRDKIYIKNINLDSIRIWGWDVYIEDSYIKNAHVKANYIKRCIVENGTINSECIENSKLTNVRIDERRLESDVKITNVDIDNTNMDLRDNEGSIVVSEENVTLENVKIKNKSGRILKIEDASEVYLNGDIIMETTGSEAILLESYSNDYKSKLYVNGNLKQIGDTYTIKAKQDGYYTEVYDKFNILSKGVDSSGAGYYNTSLRTGNVPKLPNQNIESISEVSTEDELISALENPKVEKIRVLNDITISKKENERKINIVGNNKEITGASSSNIPTLSSTFDNFSEFNIIYNDGINIKNLNLDKFEVWSDKSSIENCTIKNNRLILVGSLKNSVVENSSINAPVIENCKLTNVEIDERRIDKDCKIINVDIDNTNMNLKDNESSITVYEENVTLENVNIKNNSGKILSIKNKSKVFLNGNITIETTGSEAILLESYSKDHKSKLYVNGNLKQIGDTYTIKSKQNGYYTEVYDNNSMLNGSMDKDGTAYYNTKNRVGSIPILPTNDKNGWNKEDNVWYYYNNGIKRKGWLKDNNQWYYLGEDGKMQTGWQMVNGTWYYLENSGAMATGWKNINKTWYYLENSGVMATGWKKINGTWYYLKSSGAMASGWLDLDGTWYYLDGSGAMKTGWQKISGKWYYMYGSGAMATNTVIDGWRINSSGVATKIK